DHRRLLASQTAGRWEQFDVELLHGKTMGIVSYGSIGQACAQFAKPFGMQVVGMRRRPELSKDDPNVDRVLPLDGLDELMSISDYVVVTSPLTPETRGLVGAKQIGLMKPAAVIVNVGRGPV